MISIITIGREFGSGGREIGLKLAEQLGCSFFDKEIINEAAKRSSINRELFERFDEKALGSPLYSMVMRVSNDPVAQPLALRIQKAYAETIYELAKEPCIIIGRSADYLLRDCKNRLSFFITANQKNRIERICERHQTTAGEAEKMIVKQDKIRASYYNCMTGNVWGMAANYDFCLSSSYYGIEPTVEIMKQIIQ
ncbi:cytidylate kinase-like family protein [Lachnospiraceae bacterium]|nr:cytidylate kinase-like family protein [Lachnospiraceae bacterium]